MNTGEILFIILGLVVGVPVVFGSLTAIVGMILRHRAKMRQLGSEDDLKLLQEMHQNLERLDKRLEALETLVFEEKQHKKQ